MSTNGGWNLAIGASPRATGRFEELVGADGCGEERGQAAEDACWSRRAGAWIAADPARWIARAPKKWAHTFDVQAFAVGYLGEADPRTWSPDVRRGWMRALSVLQSIIVLVGAWRAVGARVAARRARGLAWAGVAGLGALAIGAGVAWPLVLVAASVACATPRAGRGVVAYVGWGIVALALVRAVFFGEDRYFVPLVPLTCLLAVARFRGGVRDGALVTSAG
ncbi:MAG: hypothetical protein U0414_36765 [Polyangiaceae bacterium]